MHMIKRLICLAILYFLAFFVGTLFSPDMTGVQQQEQIQAQVQKENVLVQKVTEEKKEHQGVVIGHIVGQYQNIYKAQKTASIE